jgi:ABC-2 type transport system permease protein/ribosome-dependent ATPase
MNLKRVLAVASRERREIVRDRLFFTLAFVVPTALMIIFGFGLSFDVENVPLAIVDYDGSAMSRDYTYQYTTSRYFDFQGMVRDERDLVPLITDKNVRAAIVIPEKFQENLLAGRPVSVQTLIDGAFPFRAQTIKGYVMGINSAYSAGLLADYLAQKKGMSRERALEMLQPLTLEVRHLYNQGLESDWSMAPKLIGFLLMVCPPLLTALGVVREKETGAIYNIYSSTITRAEYLTGKLTPYVVVSALNSLILWAIAIKVFDAPFKGAPLFFLAASILYVVCTTGIGLMVSVLVETQVAATLVTFITTVIPAVLYSGMLVPVASLDKAAQTVAHMLPAMYYTDIILGCFLKGVGPRVLWKDVVVLAFYAAALFATGYFMFRKRPNA